MKHTRQQIIDMSNRSHSHADALATLYQMIREEFEQERKISRRKIRASVEMTFQDYEMYPYEVYTAIAESVFAAAGWTIVDDDREAHSKEWRCQQSGIPGNEYLCQHQNKIRQVLRLGGDGHWYMWNGKQEIRTSPPEYIMPIPPLPENDK